MSFLLPVPKRTAPTFMERQRRAIEIAAEREARLADPLHQARIAASQAHSAEARVLSEARREHDKLNDPVPNPLGVIVHPQVAALIERVIEENGIVDPKAPLRPVPTIAEIAGKMLVDARKRVDEAEAETARLEKETAEPTVVAGKRR